MTEKKKGRIGDLREKLLLCGMGCFALACGATALNVTVLPSAREYHGYGAPLFYLALAAALGAFLLVGRALSRRSGAQLERAARIAVPVYLAVLFVIHLLMALLMEYVPSGDNFMIYNGAQMLARSGDFSEYPDLYLYLSRFSNQWGFLLLLSGVYRVLFALGVTQVFFATAAIQALLYTAGLAAAFSLARRFRGAAGQLMLVTMLSLCLPMYLAAAVLYTDTFSMPFVMLALFFAQRMLSCERFIKQAVYALLCALCALVGGMIKMTAAIVLIAAAIVCLLRMKIVRAAALSAMMALVMALGLAGVNAAMVGPLLDPAMVNQHNTPTVHWIMMSIPDKHAPYGTSIEDYRQTWAMQEAGETPEAVMDSILSRMKDKVYSLRYPNRLIPALLRKNAVSFGDGTFGMTEMLDDSPRHAHALSSLVLSTGENYGAYMAVCSGVFAAQLLMAFAGCLRDIKKRDLRAAVVYIAVFGLMLFMLLWEPRSRYIFNFVPAMLLLSCGIAVRGEKEAKTP